jgi:hypothetical protein
MKWRILCLIWVSLGAAAEPLVQLRFERPPGDMRLFEGLKAVDRDGVKVLEFVTPHQYATFGLPKGAMEGVKAMTVSAWVYPRRVGEQHFVLRGEVAAGVNGERFFRPEKDYVTLLAGTDHNGFLMGTINGNGSMPFPFVTLNELSINSWSHVVVAKDAVGRHRFYVNGVLVCSDEASAHAPVKRAFVETKADGPAIRLAMPMGGLMGEVAIDGTALDGEAVKKEFEAGRGRYRPVMQAAAVAFREITRRGHPNLWNRSGTVEGAPARLTRESWRGHRERILKQLPKVLGAPPDDVAAYYAGRPANDLDAKTLAEEDCGTYVRRKVTMRVQPDDLMYAWLLVPKKRLDHRSPAVICVYGTTSGAGKDTTVGLSGPGPGTPPAKNRAFAIDFVEAGFVVLAPDFLRDGERVAPGDRPYDTTRFYKRYPEWSIHGKDAYDTSRAVDYLQSLAFVDPVRIAMAGHSYGGHSTIFATALEPRIAAACASGPVSDFLHHGMHWGVPKGGGNSQSMPNLRAYLLPFHQPNSQDSGLLIQDFLQPVPVTFYEFTALCAPRPLLVFQAVGERRPFEEENAAAVGEVYEALGAADKVRYLWHPGDHDFPPAARGVAIEWFKRHLME